MNDIVERLFQWRESDTVLSSDTKLIAEAADEILRLRTENERLRDQWRAYAHCYGALRETIVEALDGVENARRQHLRNIGAAHD